MATTAPGATGPDDSSAARLRRDAAATLRQLTDLYLTLQPRDLRRSIPTVSRALGWDWSRIGPDLLDRVDDATVGYLVAAAVDRGMELWHAHLDAIADVDLDDLELRAHVLEQLRRALA
jgi:hypothetical protein